MTSSSKESLPFRFQIDENLCAITLNFGSHPKDVTTLYRINCGDIHTMLLRGRYYFLIQYPAATDSMKKDFMEEFSGFLERNTSQISRLASETRARKRDALLELFDELRKELRKGRFEGASWHD